MPEASSQNVKRFSRYQEKRSSLEGDVYDQIRSDLAQETLVLVLVAHHSENEQNRDYDCRR